IVHVSGRARWARHWPLALLGLAAFMLVRNDPGAWPLGPQGFWASMAEPTVLQHRVFVLLVVAFGLFEWTVRTRRRRSPRWALVFPLLCAVGCGLLLTHSHAGFPLGLLPPVDTLGWKYAFLRARARFRTLLAVRIAGEACNLPTPTASLGREAIKTWLLRRHVSLDEAVLSVVVAKTTIALAQ